MSQPNYKIVKWAREAAGLSLDTAAQKLGLKTTKLLTAEEKLNKFESGESPLSRSTLGKMCTLYRRPLITFYLPKIPIIVDKGEDFRTLPEAIHTEDNALVEALIRNIKVRQSVIKSALIEEEEAVSLPFIASCKIQEGVTGVAAKIIKYLNFDVNKFRSFPSANEAFSYLREVAESNKIFVVLKGNLGSHHTDIDVKTFRGFALADDIAPFIVINDKDSKAAWTFTLLHELVHLFLGQTGVSGLYFEQQIEKFCSDVASEMLLPSAEFGNGTAFVGLNLEEIKLQINSLAREVNVSRTLISYRLLRTNVINRSTWEQLRSYYREEWLKHRDSEKKKNKLKKGGPNPHVVNRYKLGSFLVNFVERMSHSGTMSVTKAGLVLGVRPIKVENLLNAGKAA